MDISHRDTIITLYDNLYNDYKDIEGLKSPN
jgi:hypothetical protein